MCILYNINIIKFYYHIYITYSPFKDYFENLPEEGEKDQGEAEPDQDGHKAGQRRVPVPVAARLCANMNKSTVKKVPREAINSELGKYYNGLTDGRKK